MTYGQSLICAGFILVCVHGLLLTASQGWMKMWERRYVEFEIDQDYFLGIKSIFVRSIIGIGFISDIGAILCLIGMILLLGGV